MERIEASVLKGPRAYFTGFDYKIVARAAHLDLLRLDVERQLKILLLTKSKVVCAASHLFSPVAFDLFHRNPRLLTDGLIIPAMRRDRQDIKAVSEARDLPSQQKRQMTPFYEENVQGVVNWDVVDTSMHFRDAFLQQLRDSRSLLLTNLRSASRKRLLAATRSFEESESFNRDSIEKIATRLDPIDREKVFNLRELLYHIFGSRAVGSESSIPEQGYIDYNPDDFLANHTTLSELNIFWKIFVELAFNSLHRSFLPVEALDLLSFSDIIEIRKPLLSNVFQEKYDAIVGTVLESVGRTNPETVILNVNQVIEARERLVTVFSEVFEQELEPFLNRKLAGAWNWKELSKSGVSFCLGLLGLVVPQSASVSAGIASLLLEGRSLFVNIWRRVGSRFQREKYNKYLARKEQAIHAAVTSIKISDKSPLLDAIDLLTTALSNRVSL